MYIKNKKGRYEGGGGAEGGQFDQIVCNKWKLKLYSCNKVVLNQFLYIEMWIERQLKYGCLSDLKIKNA